ncbi:MAG: FAD-linked oxidase C-terminal domain-containing protein [Bacteroidales bacterium]|jgi:FAD/FMN-containing dehydrogenase/Fe-S oxidoreductase|nr:FAD-linked oxidase C-terminal domain-containing protein [Bacteroidales bacterium]
MESIPADILHDLRSSFEGDLFDALSHRLQYATDASAYREIPLLVCRPYHTKDIRELVHFAAKNSLSIIPRTAGTSLAGQVVGGGIVADVSRYMTHILEINAEERWIRVEPGVVLDEMNLELEKHGLFFGPETSTSNRCMIGGMLGNNACGAHSLLYGSTRDHTLEVKAILSDGSEVLFKALDKNEFEAKCKHKNLEGELYRSIRTLLSDPKHQDGIRKGFPDPEIKRRNTGYALDLLLDTEPFTENSRPFNFSSLIAGSEGTLAFITEIKLNLLPLPPREKALVCIHCNSLEEAFKGNLIALKYKPGAVELMDDRVLELTKGNISQQKNRFFLHGDPKALLIVEFARESKEEILLIAGKMETEMRGLGYGYHFPLVFGEEIRKVWALRKAGLGVLSNMPGDAKPVAVIEDTAVKPEDLPAYMEDFRKILEKHRLDCVYHAHIGTGELHLRPVLNLKDPKDVELFRIIGEETAMLVKKYRGSLSGEHGDGRLRGCFIPDVIGEENYALLKEVKKTWDPANIFNPGKIIDTPPMNTSLRYSPGQDGRMLKTVFDFSADKDILRSVEKCNGSGDCRKSELMGGTMCPSYMATRDEQNTTRARANILREFLTHSEKKNPFDHKEIYEVMDLCLSCKGCKSECPSNVDITKYKAEFLQHYYDANGIPLRTRAIAYIGQMNKLGAMLPWLYNAAMRKHFISGMMKKMLGFAPKRSIPLLYKTTLRSWASRNKARSLTPDTRRLYLFADEFTNYNDAEIGITAMKLLQALGYEVIIPKHKFSGRTFLSKGLVRKAAKLARHNVETLSDIVNVDTPLIGIEPSGILTFRDEYPELVGEEMKEKAIELAGNCHTIDEFLANEIREGNISRHLFTSVGKKIILHGHCYQKALSLVQHTVDMLQLPENYSVEEIKSGCCGMAGAFGYEKEHYELSMKVGEMVLFPAVRSASENVLIAAAGTSCRHQIKDGTGRKAYHPVEILFDALKK